MEDTIELFIYWLTHITKIEKRYSQKEIAAFLGADPSTVSSYTRRRTKPDFQAMQIVLRETGTTEAEMILRGRQLKAYSEGQKDDIKKNKTPSETPIITPPPQNNRKSVTKITREHQELVENFKDKETAKELNHMLIKIEALDEDAYLDLYGEVAKVYKKTLSKNKKRKEKKQSEADIDSKKKASNL